MKIVSFSLEQGNKYFGRIDDTRFFIGSRVSYEGNKGLMNVSGPEAQKYDRAQFRATHGFWADFIHPTSRAEGALFGLDGAPETVCLIVADIRHQGRAKSPAIVSALSNANPLEALLKIGEPKYHERLVVLRREIKRLLADGTFGSKHYSIAQKDFV